MTKILLLVNLLCCFLRNIFHEQISRLDCKDVLEITCNLETEGEENTAFILCTTFLTQQLQQQSLYCSWWVFNDGAKELVVCLCALIYLQKAWLYIWIYSTGFLCFVFCVKQLSLSSFLQRELTLLWSKLQRRIDSSLQSLLDRCLQLGAIAKTIHHLLYLVRVIQTEVSVHILTVQFSYLMIIGQWSCNETVQPNISIMPFKLNFLHLFRFSWLMLMRCRGVQYEVDPHLTN